MRKLILLAFVFFCISQICHAQLANVEGTVIDTLEKKKLSKAVVALLKTKDSVLYKFKRTNENGGFNLNNVAQGKYLIMVTYPGYADFYDTILINASTKDFGNIYMISKIHLLEDVVVRQKIAAVRMKGDTLEMKADSFKVSANANVQELLKKMPGITVNSKGEITAQGQKVQKVLVDGEEFFSDDPAVVTQNLRADAIDKVQVFDKKSDQATFTGIDDGEKAKTINLQLKEDKKKGYFGKLDAGTDFDKYRNGKALVNSFKGKRKFAAYLTTDNTRFENMEWSERSNYGEDLNRNTQVNDDGGVSMWSNGDDFSWGQGLPSSITGGLHFSKKWDKDKKNSINTYQFNDLRVNGLNTTLTQTLLNDTTFLIDNSIQRFENHKRRNRLRSTYDWQIDSTSSLKIIATGSIINSNLDNLFTSNSANSKGLNINETNRRTTNKIDEQTLITNIFWRKRLKKKGRTISFNTDINLGNNDGNGFLFAKNNFFGSTPSVNNIDQKKTNDEKTFSLSGRLSYTEPLSKTTFLELNYRFAFNKNNAERYTLEGGTNGVGDYNRIIDSLSNHFLYNNDNNSGGFTIRHNKKKFNFAIGSSLGVVNFNLTEKRRDAKNAVSFTNFLPSASFNYTPKKQTRLGFTYNGTTRNPTLQQLNPIIDNIDPLNRVLGNPNLKQEFRHNFGINFSDYKVLKEKNIYVSANFSFVENAITSSNSINQLKGERTSQSVNVNGNYNFNMWANYGFNVAPSVNLNFQLSPSISRFKNIVNGTENINDSKHLGFNISSGYWRDKWINYWFSIGPTFNSSSSSINNVNTKYWTYNFNADVEMKLPKKWYVNINPDFNIYEKTAIFANARDIFIVNASVKKSIDKAEKWQIAFRVNDIFNQNQAINRNISSNFISETTQQNIRRFAMLNLIYNFSKNGKPSNGW
jgi:hypothetical protein